MGTSLTSTPPLVLLLALTFGGCALASASGYQPSGPDGGYSELQLAPDMFRVAFQGNTYTSRERVADLALLRAAELALTNGAPYFVVLNQLREFRSLQSPLYVTAPPYVGYASYGYAYTGSPLPPIIVQDYRTELAIRLLREDPAPSASAYSAALLRDELRHKYELDKR